MAEVLRFLSRRLSRVILRLQAVVLWLDGHVARGRDADPFV